MHIAANLQPTAAQPANRRYAPRRVLRLGSQLHESGAQVIIHDLSTTGLLLETDDVLAIQERLLVELPQSGPAAALVVWQDGRLFGCRFEPSLPLAAISAAVLLSDPARPGPDQSVDETLDVSLQDHAERSSARRTKLLLIVGISSLLWAAIILSIALIG